MLQYFVVDINWIVPELKNINKEGITSFKVRVILVVPQYNLPYLGKIELSVEVVVSYLLKREEHVMEPLVSFLYRLVFREGF